MQKILVVDDDPVMLRLASLVVSKHYQIITASSGEEALKKFEVEKPDMVLSDLMMPEMDGYELHRILQEKSPEPVPIIFMTADDNEDSERRGFDIGADDYIHKPFKADVLLRRIENVLKNQNKIRGLRQAVETDSLTGLLNKNAAQKKISELCKKHPGVLMMIDLDSFKLVNDLYGHAMGDKILIKFSELIKKIIRASDLAARMGGDEFIAFCHDIQNETTVKEKTEFLNENLLAAAKELMGKDMNIPLGTSVGAVFIPSDGTDFSMLCAKADKALYEAKQSGKHSCAFFSDIFNSQNSRKNISHMKMILAERIVKDSAFLVEINSFKEIYRLFVRYSLNFKRDVQFMQITLNTENPDAVEQFREILINNLQLSDCICQNGKKQFLILMPHTHFQECESIKEKIISKWKTSPFAKFFSPIFEFESVTE